MAEGERNQADKEGKEAKEVRGERCDQCTGLADWDGGHLTRGKLPQWRAAFSAASERAVWFALCAAAVALPVSAALPCPPRPPPRAAAVCKRPAHENAALQRR